MNSNKENSSPHVVEDIRLKKNTEQYFKLATVESPFNFYDDLIFNNGYPKLPNAFYKETIYTKGYRLILERTREFWFEAWVSKLDISDMIHYDHYLKKVLEFNINDAFEKLDEAIKDVSEQESIAFLKQQLNVLNSLIEKFDSDDKDDYHEIRTHLLQIVSDINIRYSHLQLTHKVFKKLTSEIEKTVSFFHLNQGIKSSFLEKLYDLVIDLDLIDDVETREEDFIEVFCSAKTIRRIQFIKSNLPVSVLLKEIEPFFENLNAVTIEKSKCFLNKQGKAITRTDLYTTLSRNKDNKKTELLRIYDGINLLKKQYLK